MSFASQVQKGPPPTAQRGRRCSVGTVLDSLSGEEREHLVQMLQPDSGWPHEGDGSVYEAITAEGYWVSSHQIGPHRNGKCSCYR